MKKNLFYLVFIIFSNSSMGQRYILISHLGNSDRLFPPIVLKTGDVKKTVIDSSLEYKGTEFCRINELTQTRYQLFKKNILKNRYIQKDTLLLRFEFGIFFIDIFDGNHKEMFFVSHQSSSSFFVELIKFAKRYKFDNKLISDLDYVRRLIQ